MDFSPFKHFVFDLDGTLYDTRGLPLRLIMGDLRHCLLLKAERTVRRQFKGMPFEGADDYYDALFDGISQARKVPVAQVRKWYYEGYMPQTVSILRAHYKARPEVPALFERIRARGGKIAVISDYGFVREKLDAIGISEGMADYEFEAPALGGLKPCKRTYQRMLDILGLPPEEILMVGDRLDTDGRGALDAGLAFFHIDKKTDSWRILTENILTHQTQS